MSEPDFDPTVRGTARPAPGSSGWQSLVVRPRRADEPAIFGGFDDPLFQGGGDSVILWSGDTHPTATRALEAAQRMAKRIAVLEAEGRRGGKRRWSGAYAIHCEACSDTGWIRCDLCDGRGELVEEYGINGVRDRDPTCPACGGSGNVECCEPMGRPDADQAPEEGSA